MSGFGVFVGFLVWFCGIFVVFCNQSLSKMRINSFKLTFYIQKIQRSIVSYIDYKNSALLASLESLQKENQGRIFIFAHFFRIECKMEFPGI